MGCQNTLSRGVARNLLRVTGSGGRKFPSGFQGRAPVGVWGRSPPPEAGDKCG